jgi:hypothetical protein
MKLTNKSGESSGLDPPLFALICLNGGQTIAAKLCAVDSSDAAMQLHLAIKSTLAALRRSVIVYSWKLPHGRGWPMGWGKASQLMKRWGSAGLCW